MTNKVIEYELKRSKRKTLSVSVRDGVVTVKAPNKTPVADIERFVNKHADWIEKKRAEHDVKADMLKPVTDGDAVLLHGSFVRISRTGEHGRIALADGVLNVPCKYAVRQKENAAIAAWLKRSAEKELSALLNEYSAWTGLGYKAFATTNARTKWGSCDGNCNIRLNWRLIMLDRELTEYVIVHELAHTVHHDHSAAFWTEVKKHLPQYAAQRKRLKMFSAVTGLYR